MRQKVIYIYNEILSNKIKIHYNENLSRYSEINSEIRLTTMGFRSPLQLCVTVIHVLAFLSYILFITLLPRRVDIDHSPSL